MQPTGDAVTRPVGTVQVRKENGWPRTVTLTRLHPDRPTPRDAYEWTLYCWQCAVDSTTCDPDVGMLDTEPTRKVAFAAAEAHEARLHGGADTVVIHRRLKGAY